MKSLIEISILIHGFVFGQIPSIDEKVFQGFNSQPYLTPTSAPTTSITINWNTKNPEPSFIAYGLSQTMGDTIRDYRHKNFHHIILNNLQPNTTYYYKILPDGIMRKFKTFPISADSFSFVVFGDTRTDSAKHQAVIDRISQYDFDFIVHTGDLVGKGSSTADWITFFNIECDVISQKLFLPAIGNHEKPFWQYDTLFLLPGLEEFYSVRYANAAIICLNTETELTTHQTKWLINELNFISTDTTIHWIFINFHRPPYSSGSHGSDIKVRNSWCPIFEKYRVDIVFCGHDHSYERTEKINGVIYVVCGGGGAPLYNVGRNDWTAYSEKTHHFCLINIKQKELILKAINPDGTVFDSLKLKK